MTKKSPLFRLFLATIVLLIIATNPIKAQQGTETHNDSLRALYNESLKQWKQLKAEHNDSYEFVVGWESAFGFGHATTITVREGQVVSREYKEYNSPDYEESNNEEFEHVSEEDSIPPGTLLNPTDGGFRGITFDQVYKECGEIHLQADENENWLYFTTDRSAILHVCIYTPIGCEDDCSEGVYISKFKWLE